MDNINNRLSAFLEHMHITMTEFERRSGISGGLGSKLSEKSRASTFRLISIAFPQLNVDWLRTGYGSMLNRGTTTVCGDNVTSGNVLSSVDNRQGTFYSPSVSDSERISELERENAHLKEEIALLKDFNQSLKQTAAELRERIQLQKRHGSSEQSPNLH